MIVAIIVVASQAVATAAPAVPAMTGDVTVAGSATAFARVRLTRAVDLNDVDLTRVVTVSGSPRTMGFALLPDARGSVAPAILAARVPTERGFELGFTFGGYDSAGRWSLVMRPGTYRLYLLSRGGGSGTARVRLPGLSRSPMRIAAAQRAAMQVRDFTAPVLASGYVAPAFAPTLDISATTPGSTFAALWVHSDVSAYHRVGACFYAGSAPARDVPVCSGTDTGGVERIGPVVGKHDRFFAGAVYGQPPGKAGYGLYTRDLGAVRSAGATILFLPVG